MRTGFKICDIIICVCCITLLSGCDKPEAVRIIRADSAAYSGAPLPEEMTEGVELWKKYSGIDKENIESFWQDYSNSQAVKVFYPDIENRIGDKIPDIESRLGEIKSGFGKSFPEINFPEEIYGIVSPYSQSVMLSDSLALIALNHYLGDDYEGYNGMPVEMRALKAVQNIPLDVAEALLRVNYSFNGDSWSPLLNKMIYEGAIAAAIKQVSGVSDNAAIGVSAETFSQLKENEASIWKDIVESGLLYSSSPKVADEMIKPYPPKRYPSRAGRYFGFRIAESAFNRGLTINNLLSPDFYMSADALMQSGYSPRIK
ncbi:MAG: hypothetical protein K2H39_09025 [Paramuribaculum sp.]|nr:hypothetical protein [Paramuribaculum sp.]